METNNIKRSFHFAKRIEDAAISSRERQHLRWAKRTERRCDCRPETLSGKSRPYGKGRKRVCQSSGFYGPLLSAYRSFGHSYLCYQSNGDTSQFFLNLPFDEISAGDSPIPLKKINIREANDGGAEPAGRV